MSTVQNLIDDALMSIGKHTIGDTQDAGIYTYCLRRLNGMISGWGNQFNMIYKSDEVSFPLDGSLEYTIAPSGATITAPKPISLISAQYSVGGVRYDMRILGSQEEWANAYRLENFSSWAEAIFLENAHPLAILKIYPKMTGATATINYWAALDKFTATSNTIDWPEGYEEMMMMNLACIIAPAFGTEASPEIRRQAQNGAYAIRRTNLTIPMLSSEYPSHNGTYLPITSSSSTTSIPLIVTI